MRVQDHAIRLVHKQRIVVQRILNRQQEAQIAEQGRSSEEQGRVAQGLGASVARPTSAQSYLPRRDQLITNSQGILYLDCSGLAS